LAKILSGQKTQEAEMNFLMEALIMRLIGFALT